MKFILLNGAKYSGKDTGARELLSHMERVNVQEPTFTAQILKFATPLKRAVHTAFGIYPDPNFFEHCKEEPQEVFFGKTPRQMYIDFSEEYMKSLYGQRIFGELLLREANKLSACRDTELVIIIPDSGFQPEAQVLFDAVGPENMLILHPMRNGTNHKGDSRGYIELPGVKSVYVENNTTPEEFGDKLWVVVDCFLAQ